MFERSTSAASGDAETVEAERGAEVGARLRFFRFERDAGGVGDPVDRIEEADHPGRVGETGRTYRFAQRSARSGERPLVLAEYGFGEFHEQAAVRNAAIVLHRSGHRVQIVISIVGHAARTEQQGVTGSSIETLVQGGDPRRQQFDLRVADRAVFAREVAHFEWPLVLVRHDIEEALHLVGHPGSSPS